MTLDLDKLQAHLDGMSPTAPWVTAGGKTLDWNREALIAFVNAMPELLRLARDVPALMGERMQLAGELAEKHALVAGLTVSLERLIAKMGQK